MNNAPLLYDRQRLLARRRRAYAAACGRTSVEKAPDFLLHWAVDDMMERLKMVQRDFPQAAEVMGHTGLLAKALRDASKNRRVTRVEACQTFLNDTPEVDAKVGDEEHLPLPLASQDLIVAPLCLHTTNDVPGALIQMRKALKPDGLLMAVLPGEDTLQELRESLLAAETEITGGAALRVLPFARLQDLGSLLQRAGLKLPVIDAETLTVRYDTMFDLMRDLRAMGQTNCLSGTIRPLRRDVLARAAQIYAERFSDRDGRVRATFTMLSLSAWAEHDSQQKPLAHGSAKISLADALDPAWRPPSGGKPPDQQ